MMRGSAIFLAALLLSGAASIFIVM